MKTTESPRPDGWLRPDDVRMALGCMRAFTNMDDPERGAEAIRAALDAGITILDTARAYGDSERVVGRVVRERGVAARVVTKGGMLRDGKKWEPDGRGRTLLADCEASLAALDGTPIDTYLVHAPDSRVAWGTTVRALAKIADEKLAAHVGVCNVSRRQLDEALDLAPIAVVQVDLDQAVRGGVAARCFERGIAVMIHSPFGGPKRAPGVARDARVASIAERHGVTPHAAALAMLLDLHPYIVPVAGATRPETVRDCLRALTIHVEHEDAETSATGAEVVLIMGLQGSGKSTRVEEWALRGYERLNRDARGGTLRGLHMALGELLARGARKVVLDNTYTTRASRYDAITTARAHGASVHGVWIEASVEDAQVNVIERMLAAHGRLLEPREMARLRDPSALPPTALLRMVRELERPERDEGFTTLDTVAFTRTPSTRSGSTRFVAHDARPGPNDITFAWQRDAMLVCKHEGGPPSCWCRPPYPGLLLAYARAHDIDLARSEVVGTSPAHAKMAAAVGASYSQRR
jgi:aryl-alcohol dehydrogenase-like predicted oxidoreductase/predicted kinase